MKFCKICKLQIFFMKESLRVGDFQDEFDIFPNRSDTVVKNCQNTITPDNHHRFIVLIKEDWLIRVRIHINGCEPPRLTVASVFGKKEEQKLIAHRLVLAWQTAVCLGSQHAPQRHSS